MNVSDIYHPKVSIITPTFNRLHFLVETSEHVLRLNFDNWEWIIIDDGSTDGTQEFLFGLQNERNNIRYFRRSANHLKGPSGCRNQGIDLAKGEYLVFVDDDDIVHPDLLKIITPVLDKNPEASFCRFDKKPFTGVWNQATILKKEGESQYSKFSRKEVSKMITGQIPFACCTVTWKKNDIGNERFNENLSYAEEWEFFNRLILKNNYGISLSEILYYNRKHENSNTGGFWSNDPVRRLSKIEATVLVIEALKKNDLLGRDIFKYFVQLGFFLKSEKVIKRILNSSDVSLMVRIKYRLGYKIYPILRPILKLKGKIKNLECL